jgi:hypothetical protein
MILTFYPLVIMGGGRDIWKFLVFPWLFVDGGNTSSEPMHWQHSP